MKPLIKRYPKDADETRELLKFTAEKGRPAGMRLAGVRDWLAWTNWLKDVTGNPNFGICPTNPDSVKSDREILRSKTHSALSQLLSALDTVAEGERQKLIAEKQLRFCIWKYKEARRNREPRFGLCEVLERG